MGIKRIHPYVESADPEIARDFYVGVFGLEVAMDEPVIALLSPDVPSAQLIITQQGTGTPRADFGIDVGDGAAVDLAYDRARAMGMRIVYPLTDGRGPSAASSSRIPTVASSTSSPTSSTTQLDASEVGGRCRLANPADADARTGRLVTGISRSRPGRAQPGAGRFRPARSA
jgi:catechol 2,3-dioxygenase-like lactoylglutathione lyase family enzyme